MRLVAEIQRARLLIAQYEEHLAYFRGTVEDNRYLLGRLDERIGRGP
jgi:hypothetical protein